MDPVTPRTSRTAPDPGSLFDAHFDYVWRVLRHLGISDADREDVVHEVFLAVFGRLGDFDPERPIRPWLFGFAYRVAIAHRRLAHHRREVLGDVVEAIDSLPAADERIVADEELALLEEALAALDPDRRTVLLLHDFDELPVPAIARELDIPVNTAYSRLRLARADLAAVAARLRRRGGG
jgi:RNA polymerase sigma-70 factor (ECF subfamily)